MMDFERFMEIWRAAAAEADKAGHSDHMAFIVFTAVKALIDSESGGGED